jgi:hypothetical protein
MGSGTWSADAWGGYSSRTAHKTTDAIYTTKTLTNLLDPKGVIVRESRDSPDNPQSNAIIVALDVTGSMGELAGVIARQGLNVLIQGIHDRRPVTDPHVMIQAIGDARSDQAPLQVTQFEADIRLTEQLEKIWLEGHGGGNNTESYDFAWYFAAVHTSIDCFEKRGKKGYLFTVGDEEAPAGLTAAHIARFIGGEPTRDFTAQELLDMASRSYEVFHIIVEEGSHFRRQGDRVVSSWNNLLGQRAIRLSDHTKLAEVILSTIQVNEGECADKVAASWSGNTALVVRNAVGSLTKAGGDAPASGAVRV